MASPERHVVQSRNRLLARLSPAEFTRIAPLLREAPLVLKDILYHFHAPIERVYFPLSGIVSAMAIMEDGTAIEVATIGNEGMAGLTALVGGQTSPYETMVQVAGNCLIMDAATFTQLAQEPGEFRETLIHYHTAFSIQVSYSVACNGLHTIEKRCARWLLMTHDRVGSDDLPLTHEFLAIMLGVRRASVTDVLQPFQADGIIRNNRGEITVLNRTALETRSCECYRVVNEQFARLFGSKGDHARPE